MSKKRSLHVMVDGEIYERLRYFCCYEGVTLAEVLRSLLIAFLAEKELEAQGLTSVDN